MRRQQHAGWRIEALVGACDLPALHAHQQRGGAHADAGDADEMHVLGHKSLRRESCWQISRFWCAAQSVVKRRAELPRAARATLAQESLAEMILSGFCTGSPRLILSTFSMPT